MNFTNDNERKIQELNTKLEEDHLMYLEADDSPHKLAQRCKLEARIREYLCLVPNDRKFIFEETAEILCRSAACEEFTGYRASTAWSAISLYASNLLSQPWRKEYKNIKTFCGYFKHEVEAHLVDAELMFELMGYSHNGIGVLTLNGPIDPDKVKNVSRDAIVAFVECNILKQIWEEVSNKYNISWREILDFRKKYVGTPEQAIQALNYRWNLDRPNNCTLETRFRPQYIQNYHINDPMMSMNSCQKIPNLKNHNNNSNYNYFPNYDYTHVNKFQDPYYSQYARQSKNTCNYKERESNDQVRMMKNSVPYEIKESEIHTNLSSGNVGEYVSTSNTVGDNRLDNKYLMSNESNLKKAYVTNNSTHGITRYYSNTFEEPTNKQLFTILNNYPLESGLKIENNIRPTEDVHCEVAQVTERQTIDLTDKPDEIENNLNNWNCEVCTFLNADSFSICQMCSKSRQKKNEDEPLISGGKECPQCTLINKKSVTECDACSANLINSPTYI